MTEDQTSYVVHRYEAAPKPVSVRLESHGAPGSDKHYYSWEISVTAEALPALLVILRETNAQLQREYGGAD